MTPSRILPTATACAALILSAAAPSLSRAAFENFDQYPVGEPIAGQGGGADWSGAWRSNTKANAAVSDETITYELGERILGGGNSLKITGNADDALARFTTSAPDASGTDYFVSFIFRLEGKPAGTLFTGNVFAGWQAEDGNPSTSIDNIGYLGGGGRAGARVNNLSTAVTTPLQYGKTYRFVIKYTGWNVGRYSTTQVWLDPSEGDEMSTNTAITQTRTASTGGSSGFRGIRVRTLGLSPDAYYLIDDLRIATSWGDLLEYPEIPDNPGPETYVITAGPDWIPFAHSLEVAPGGVFDFSHLLDAPAGRHGPVRVNGNGQFEFTGRPDVRVRFAGVNLNYSAQFLTNEDADALADTLARSGYNTVRLHHFDGQLRTAGGDSHQIDPAKLERLDYLFHALKQRGLYISIDLYSTRGFNADEIASFGLSGNAITANTFKALIPIDENAYEAWRLYAEKLLTHVNPHTGLAWGMDPALVGICPVNEDNLYNHHDAHPAVKERYETAFNLAHPPAGEAEAERNALRYRFLCGMHAASDARLIGYLRSLGTTALLTGTNYGATQALAYQRFDYDYVDNHSYFNHPSYPGSGTVPLNNHNDSLVRRRATMPRDVMPSRIFGKPYTITEWYACRPNQFRAEAAAIMPAYASLQDWDGLWCFQYGDTRDMVIEGGVSGAFAAASDPIGLMVSRLTSLLFQRGDIAPASRSVVWAVRPEEAFATSERGVSSHFLYTGLISQVGSLPGQPSELAAGFDAVVTGANPTPAGTLPQNGYIADNETLISRMIADGVLPEGSLTGYGETTRVVSDTEQITLDAAAGTATVVTARSELFVLAANTQLTGDRVSVSNGATPGTIAVITLESARNTALELASARRVLVTHLTDSLPTGTRFAAPDRRQLQSWGQLPHLMLRGDATLALNLPEGDWSAWVVDASGARVRPQPLSTTGDGVWFMQISTVGVDGAQFAYELERTLPAPQVLGAASHRLHRNTQTFALPILATAGTEAPAGNVPVECRVAGELRLVVRFDRPIDHLDATIREGNASVASISFEGNDVILHLLPSGNGQILGLLLANIETADGGILGAASLRLGLLHGDVSGNGIVNTEDIALVRNQAAIGGAVSAENFRLDLNTSGNFSAADFALVRAAAAVGKTLN